MMELGSGIAIAGLCISGGAVAITAIRTFGRPIGGIDGKGGINGKNGLNAVFPCKDHSGIVVGLDAIKANQERQEAWMRSISSDVKRLLEK